MSKLEVFEFIKKNGSKDLAGNWLKRSRIMIVNLKKYPHVLENTQFFSRGQKGQKWAGQLRKRGELIWPKSAKMNVIGYNMSLLHWIYETW